MPRYQTWVGQFGAVAFQVPAADDQIRRVELEPRDVLLIASDGIGTVQDGINTIARTPAVQDAPDARELSVSRGGIRFETHLVGEPAARPGRCPARCTWSPACHP